MFKPHHLMIQVYRIFEFMVTGHHTHINITKKIKVHKKDMKFQNWQVYSQ